MEFLRARVVNLLTIQLTLDRLLMFRCRRYRNFYRGIRTCPDLPLAVWSVANLGGGIVCEYPGVIPIDSNQLLEEAASDPKFKPFFKR